MQQLALLGKPLGSLNNMVQLVFLAGLIGVSPALHLYDSVGLEVVDGKTFVLHKVESKETLYRLSKRYGAPIPEIIQYNEKVASGGLQAGQMVRIPYHQANAISVAQPQTVPVNATAARPNPKPAAGFHRVSAGETLYSLSVLYQVSVRDLKDWNNIPGSDLRVSQVIRVAGDDKVVGKGRGKANAAAPATRIDIAQNFADSGEVKEQGKCGLMEGPLEERRCLALHSVLPKGAIARIRNTANDREVFVRIVGKLPPEKANAGFVLEASQATLDRLGGKQPPVSVEVKYYK